MPIKTIYLALLFVGLSFSTSGFSQNNNFSITPEAVLGDLVVMTVNGSRHKIRVGEKKGSIEVISADPNYVVFSINGKEERVKVGAASVSGNYARSQKVEIIQRNDLGMYSTPGSINKRASSFLVDTGATYVSISETQAKSLGIDYLNGKKTQASTANGVIPAYIVTLDTVRVGRITLRNVDGLVTIGANMGGILLGMSFLNRVDVSYKDGLMTLKTK